MLCAKHKNPNSEQNRHGHSLFLTFCPLGKADVNQLVTVCVRACMLSFFSPVWLFVTPWTIGCQTPLSMGFSGQEYWSGLPFPTPPGDLPNPGIEPASPVSPALTGRFFTTEPPGKPSPQLNHVLKKQWLLGASSWVSGTTPTQPFLCRSIPAAVFW